MEQDPLVHVIAVSYQRFGELKVFVQSWLNQTSKNWILTVIHDGPSEEFTEVMTAYRDVDPARIEFYNTEKRYNDWGHSLREIGLNSAKGDYVMLTNADNYFIPKAVEFINEVYHSCGRKNIDVILYNMVHSHNTPGGRDLPSYSFFDVQYSRHQIDMTSGVVATHLAKRVGFRDKLPDGDATYYEDIHRAKLPEKLMIFKSARVLVVHN